METEECQLKCSVKNCRGILFQGVFICVPGGPDFVCRGSENPDLGSIVYKYIPNSSDLCEKIDSLVLITISDLKK